MSIRRAVKFKLKAILETSDSLPKEALDSMKEFIEDANKGLLLKGLRPEEKEEGASVTGWSLDGNHIRLNIESGRGVRAHDALLRLRRFLADKLGRAYRIGIREVGIESCIVEMPSQAAFLEDAKKLLDGIAKVTKIGDSLVIGFEGLSEKDLQDRLIDRAIGKLEALMAQEKPKSIGEKPSLVPLGTTIRTGSRKPVKFMGDVTAEAEALGWIKRYPGRGQWILTAPMACLVMTIKDLIIETILKPMGFLEWMLPKLTPFEVMAKMPGYFDQLAEGMIYASTPPRNPEALKDFKRDFELRKRLNLEALKAELSDPAYVLEPAQCTPFYEFFSGETVALENLPIKVYDASGWTWRWEGQATHGLDRTVEFYRVESVWMADPKEALEIRDQEAEKSLEFADKILDLEVRLVIGAPFYMTTEAASKTMIDISDPANYPTIDLEAWLPYRGEREKSEWLEIGGAFTCAKEKYVKSFRIREAKGREVWTGCGGFGITRWAEAFLAQHGFDFDGWPKAVRERIGKLPSPINLVTWPKRA
ncbi:MAG: aminoacyl--tRNA ligase-related protein [Candidatus Bathyarchaeia archaeon]